MDMEAREASAEKPALGRVAMLFVGLVTIVALAPVAGMVIAFAIIPALPIVLAIGLVLGPVNWLEDRLEEAERRRGHDEGEQGHPTPLVHAHA
jgi:hypothetical protein